MKFTIFYIMMLILSYFDIHCLVFTAIITPLFLVTRVIVYQKNKRGNKPKKFPSKEFSIGSMSLSPSNPNAHRYRH